jgi:hypothetical protein
MKKICLIMPYFGTWPCWMNFFLRSCTFNPSITWHLFTDCDEPDYTSENVTFTRTTLAAFNELASDKLHLKINITRPYKLCDLRPAYQVIFDDFLHGYDFWGYGDLDVIYGNIRKFVTDDILDEYDVITAREEAIAGHFSLFRNSDKTNRLYEVSPRYKHIFQDTANHYAFDEICKPYGFEKIQAKTGNFIKKLVNYKPKGFGIDGQNYFTSSRKAPNDITHIVKDRFKKGMLTLYHKRINRSKSWYQRRGIKNWKVLWESGNILDIGHDGIELAYFHFLASRRIKAFHVPEFDKDLSRFFITKHGITLD